MKTVDLRMSQLLTVVFSGFLVVISWRQGVQAAMRSYAKDRAQVTALTQQIKQVEALVEPTQSVAAWMTEHQQRAQALAAQFPDQRQLPQLLNTLIDTLKSSDITVVNVAQGNLEPVRDGEPPVLMQGASCHRLPVAVTVEGRFHPLLNALGKLTDATFPALVGVEKTEFRLLETTGTKLQAVITLHLYVIGSATVPAPNA